VRIECRFEADTLWLTQKLMAELFQKDVRTINEHLVKIYAEGELEREATIRKFRIVRAEGHPEVEPRLSEDSVVRKFRITASHGKRYETATCKESLQVRHEGR